LHVGAHLAEEEPIYVHMGFREINWIEAQPEVFIKLIKKVPPASCIQAAIWSERTILQFNVSSNSVSSSIFEFGELTPWKELSTLSRIDVEAITLNDAVVTFNQRNRLMSPFFLVLDIQGAEMEALKNLKQLAPSILAISCEVSKVPTYTNGAARKSIMRYLVFRKFIPISSFLDSSTGHGDQLFVRADHLLSSPKLILFSILRAVVLKLIRLKNTLTKLVRK
jgi:FkbM family methyltransferase